MTINDTDMHRMCDRDIVRLGRENDDLRRANESARDAIASAIDDLQRWQYTDDLDQLRHEVGMVINALQRA